MTIDKNCQVKLFGTTQPSINAIRFALYQEKEGTYVWLPGFQLVNEVIEPRAREERRKRFYVLQKVETQLTPFSEMLPDFFPTST